MEPKDPPWCPFPERPSHRSEFWKMRGGRPPRHWFFIRILFAVFGICALTMLVPLLFGGALTFHNLLRHLAWTVLIMCVGFMVIKRMFRPFRMLMRGVQEISNGNLDFQFKTQNRHGEIYYLAENFNEMISRVKEMVASKDQLLLDVSHELRSPLTRMKVALEMMPKNQMRSSLLQDIGEMETMLAEILETQRLKGENGKLVLAPVDLTALARSMVLKYKARKPGVNLEGKPAPFVVQADEDRVKTALRNVLENALKYSLRQNQSVQVQPVRVSLDETGSSIRVWVEDSGVGIPIEDQEKVFEPFYRVDKSRTKKTGGYGLGLSLCREIMRAHGGEITLESVPGKGTRVVLEFPKEPRETK
jgi:signal transduction histidine kinase